MNQSLTLQEICDRLYQVETGFINFCDGLDDSDFFYQPSGKWSAAQQVKHLVIAANQSRIAFSLPPLLVRLIGGTSRRPGRSYDELVGAYKQKLEDGGKASGRYIPKSIPASTGKRKMLAEFKRAMDRLIDAARKWKGSGIDNYFVPHPLLRKISLRELGYFTIHHTEHHQENIGKMLRP